MRSATRCALRPCGVVDDADLGGVEDDRAGIEVGELARDLALIVPVVGDLNDVTRRHGILA